MIYMEIIFVDMIPRIVRCETLRATRKVSLRSREPRSRTGCSSTLAAYFMPGKRIRIRPPLPFIWEVICFIICLAWSNWRMS